MLGRVYISCLETALRRWAVTWVRTDWQSKDWMKMILVASQLTTVTLDKEASRELPFWQTVGRAAYISLFSYFFALEKCTLMKPKPLSVGTLLALVVIVSLLPVPQSETSQGVVSAANSGPWLRMHILLQAFPWGLIPTSSRTFTDPTQIFVQSQRKLKMWAPG